MAKKTHEPQPLTLTTLSGTYEASRAVLNIIPISQISTFSQLETRLKAVLRDKEQVVLLFDALTRLDDHSLDLGLTTLVRALDHPLVPRVAHAIKAKV